MNNTQLKDKMSNNQIITNNEIIQDNDKKEEKKRFEFIPFECINYSKFDEMKRKLESFYSELHKSTTDNIKIENENVKKSVFSSLEKLLTEITLIKEEKLKILKIDEVFKWFKRKLSSFHDIKIDFKAARKHIEKFSVPDSYKKPDNNEREKVLKTLNLDNKRTMEAIESPNKKLKQLQAKKIVPIKLKVNENIKNNRFTNFFKTNEISFQIIIEDLDLIENEDKSMYNEDSIFNMFAIEDENTKNRKHSATKFNQFRMTNLKNNFINNSNRNTQNNGFSYNNSSRNLNNENNNLSKNKANQINPKRFLSTGQLITDLNNLNQSDKNRTSIISSSRLKYKESKILLDKKISVFKDTEIIEKRNYEEMKEFLNKCDKNESIFKKELEKKHELKSMLNFHEKNFMENQENNLNNFINLDALTFKKYILPDPVKHKSNNSINVESFPSNFYDFLISSTDNFCIICEFKIIKKTKIKVDTNFSLKNEIRKANKNIHNLKRLNFDNIKNFKNRDFEDGNKKNFKMFNNTIGQNLIKINIRFNEEDVFLSKIKKNPNIKKPLDSNSSVTTTYDKSFGSPSKFTKLSQISEINYKTDEIIAEDNNTLSIYGEFNMAISVSPFGDYNNTQRNATGFDFTYKNSENCENENFNFNSFGNNKNNFLMQRKTVSFNQKGFFNNFNSNNILTLKQKSRRINFNFSHDAIKKAFLPPAEDKIYPKYFLPEPGYGLITKAKILNEEKKKEKKFKSQS